MRNISVGVQCPDCRKRFEVKVKRTFINSIKSCPHCNATFEFTGNGLRKTSKAADARNRDS